MKKYFRISVGTESTLMHMFSCLCVSFVAMLFLNLFIGSMGGISAFTALFFVFFLQRGMVLSGNRVGHQLAMTSKTETAYLYVNYVVWYLVIWGVMKLVILLSRITGWGRIDGMTASMYLNQIYGSTILERWAYLFSGILMAAFVFSLFPLVLIKKWKAWAAYLTVDLAISGICCAVITGICKLFIENTMEKRAKCVMDYLVLCKLPQKWEAVLYIGVVFAMMILVVIFTYKLSCKIYGPKQGKLLAQEMLSISESMRPDRTKPKLFLAGGFFAVIAVLSGYVFFIQDSGTAQYHKVAEYLTNDTYFAPIFYAGEVYLPIPQDLGFYEDGIAMGYLAEEDTNCETRFYQLTESNLLYKGEKWDGSYLQLYGTDMVSYQLAVGVEVDNAWQEDQIFVLWDEEWNAESLYGKDLTGYTVCDRELIENLEAQFGVVAYRPEQFEENDAYFTISGYEDIKEAFQEDVPIGDWVGCILVKDNRFYYGNYENRITGENEKALLEVLGGY